MNAIEKLLTRLNGVKQTMPDKWMARCPAHEDRSPSLSLREMADGRVLIHCFSGCGAVDVVESVGLRMSDLFAGPLANHLPPVRGGFSARELLELNAHEAAVVALIAADAETRPLTPSELQRLAQAAARLGKAQGLAHGG